jgi:hypothetical protein
MKRLTILAVFLLLLTGSTTAFAQSTQSVTIVMQGEELGQLQGAKVEPTKVTGSATITAVDSGIRVNVKLTGLNPNQQSAGHIHTGKCGQQGNVVIPLNNISADASGAGSSETTLPNASFNEVTNGTYYVQYHIQVSPPGRQISCGNIIMPANAPTSKGNPSSMPAVPATGVGSLGTQSQDFSLNWMLLLIGVGLLSLAGTGLFLYYRRETRQ